MIIILIILTVFFFCIKDDMGFDSNYMNYFPSDDPIVQDTIYFAKTLGGTDPYYLTIKAPNNEANFFLKPENLKLVYAYESAVMAADPDLVQVLSFSQYVSFLNEIYNGKKSIPNKEDINKDKYYWAGWVLAQFQHKKGYSFFGDLHWSNGSLCGSFCFNQLFF